MTSNPARGCHAQGTACGTDLKPDPPVDDIFRDPPLIKMRLFAFSSVPVDLRPVKSDISGRAEKLQGAEDRRADTPSSAGIRQYYGISC
jgi:hypothetical protein